MAPKKKTWKTKSATVKRGDVLITDGRPSDMVIAIMGPTGAGKSTFINTFFNMEVTAVGHELKSCTQRLIHRFHPHPFDPDRRLVIVDTPGFDDTCLDDAEILRRISVWLASSYASDMKLAGAIYLHNISVNRMLGATSKNLELFRKMIGKDALSSVILGTTKWSEVSEKVGNARQKLLKDKMWWEMIKNGSEVFRFDNTEESASIMINHCVLKSNLNHNVFLLQKELVDLHRTVPNTESGKMLRNILEQFLRLQKDKGSAPQNETQKALEAVKALEVSLPSSLWLKFSTRLENIFRYSGSPQKTVGDRKRG
ncbi:P-loop containing nucleoside triphosphate hydrolase protein [Cyathus striatus]|nr:P-loop containing nucleoside triphosphate hydrolase protein [Cyathus striatus]